MVFPGFVGSFSPRIELKDARMPWRPQQPRLQGGERVQSGCEFDLSGNAAEMNVAKCRAPWERRKGRI